MAPPCTLPEKLAMSGVISMVMEIWWAESFMARARVGLKAGAARRNCTKLSAFACVQAHRSSYVRTRRGLAPSPDYAIVGNGCQTLWKHGWRPCAGALRWRA